MLCNTLFTLSMIYLHNITLYTAINMLYKAGVMQQLLDNLKNVYFDGISYHFTGEDPYLYVPDTHDGFEILHVVSGSGYILINNRIYEMLPNSVFFINGARFHYSNPIEPDKYVRNKVHFSQSEIIKFLQSIEQAQLLDPFLKDDSSNTCIRLVEETNDIIDQIFLEMYKESTERKFGYRLVIAGLMLKIMSLALRDRAGSATEEMQSLDKVSTNAIRVIEYVENNLADFDLDKMADSLYLNKYYLCHMFKKVTGLTVYKFLLTKRIESAKILLSSSDKPISQIAMELGFGSFSLFSSNFRKICGMTPREYRKSHRSDAIINA